MLISCGGLVFTISAIVLNGSKSALLKCYFEARNVKKGLSLTLHAKRLC